MKRNIASVAIAGLFLGVLSSAAVAQQSRESQQSGHSFYGTAELGFADVNKYDSGTVLILNGGVDLDPRTRGGLSLEGELTSTVSKPSRDVLGVTENLSYYTLGGYGVYTVPVHGDLGIRGRAGVIYKNFSDSGTFDDGLGFSAGLGATYSFNRQLDAIVEYTFIDQDINHFSAGIQVHF